MERLPLYLWIAAIALLIAGTLINLQIWRRLNPPRPKNNQPLVMSVNDTGYRIYLIVCFALTTVGLLALASLLISVILNV